MSSSSSSSIPAPDAAAAAAAAAAADGSDSSKYSAARVRERINANDGTVAPVTAPKITKDGLFQRPAGRTRKGMEWDSRRGIWVPTASADQQETMPVQQQQPADSSRLDSNKSVVVFSTTTAVATATTSTTSTRNHHQQHRQQHAHSNSSNSSDDDKEEDLDIIARRVTALRRRQSEFYLTVNQVEEIIQPVWLETLAANAADTTTTVPGDSGGMMLMNNNNNAHAKLEWLLLENLRLANNKNGSNNNKSNNNAHGRRKAWHRAQHLQKALDRKIHEVKKLRRKNSKSVVAAAAAAVNNTTSKNTLQLAAAASKNALNNVDILTSQKSIHDTGTIVVAALTHVAAAAIIGDATLADGSGAARAVTGNSGSGIISTICENVNVEKNAAIHTAAPATAVAAAQRPVAAAASNSTTTTRPATAAAASCTAPSVTKPVSNQTSNAAAAQHAKQQPVLPASTTTTTTTAIANQGNATSLPVLPKQPQQSQQSQQQHQQSSAKSGALKDILQSMSKTAETTTTNKKNSTSINNNLPNAAVTTMPVWADLPPAPPKPAADLSSLPPPPPYTKRSILAKNKSSSNNAPAASATSAAATTTTTTGVPSLPQPPAYTQRSTNVTMTTTTTTTLASTSHHATTSSSSTAIQQQSSSSSSSSTVAPITGTSTTAAAIPPEQSRASRWGAQVSAVVASSVTTTANSSSTLTGTKPVAVALPGGAPAGTHVARLPQPPMTVTTTTTTQHKAAVATTSAVAKSSTNNSNNNASSSASAATQTTTTGTTTIASTTAAPPPVLAQNHDSGNAIVHATLSAPPSATSAPPVSSLPVAKIQQAPIEKKQQAQSVVATTESAENTILAPDVRRNSSTATAATMQPNSTFPQSSSAPPSSQSSNGNATTMPSASSAPKPTKTTPATAAAATNFSTANSTNQPTIPPAKSHQPKSNWPSDMASLVWQRVKVNVEGFNLSQDEWSSFVQNSVADAPAHLKGYLRTLAAHDNVPRRQPQFATHVHKLLHLQGAGGMATSNRLWIFLKDKLGKNAAIALSKQKEVHAVRQQGGGLDIRPIVPRHEHHHSEVERAQEACRRLALSITSAPSYLRSHVQTIVDLKVVPRSKEELLAIAKRKLNLRDKALDEVWNYLVKHVHSSEQQNAKTTAPAGRDSRTAAFNNSGANTTAAQPLSFRGHSSGSSVGTNVPAAPAAARGYSLSSATRTVSDTSSAALAAAPGTTAASTSSISRAPAGAEKTSATTNRTTSGQAIRPGNALNTASSNSNNYTTATQSTASMSRRQDDSTGFSTASSVTAAQPPPKNGVTSTLAGSQKKLIAMKICPDDTKQPFSGFHPQYQTAGRGEVKVAFLHEQNAAAIPSATLCKRMKEWDPFWDLTFVVTELTGQVEYPKGKTWARTAGCLIVDLDKIRRENGPKFSQVAKCEWGIKKTSGDLKDGESRLLLKMMPLHPPSGTGKKAKADGHLWPKGTFLQITSGKVTQRIRIQQRKQQQHHEKLWKDMSHYFDLSEYLSPNSWHQPFRIDMICHDEEPYFICVAFCRYRSAGAIFKMLTTPTSIAPIRRVFESKEEARRKIVNLASSQMIVLDDDDGSSEKSEHAGVFSFSLVDSYSKKLIKTPVRGSRCSHFQCFDLEQFIVGNVMVSGNRWRCLVCENFIPISDLELCGLTQSILTEYAGQASSALNRIEFYSNGTHQLLNESNNRKRAAAVPNPQDNPQECDAKKAKTTDAEVIVVD